VDGRHYTIKHPDFISVSENPRGREVTVYDKGAHRLDVLLIAEIEEPEEPATERGSKRKAAGK
jgi:hypothetical protein